MLTEIYLCHACSCHETLRTGTTGQGLDGIDFDADLTLVTPAVLAHARAAGLAVGVWVSKSLPGCDLLPSWREFAERGVDFFTSDLPPAVWEWDRARRARTPKAAI